MLGFSRAEQHATLMGAMLRRLDVDSERACAQGFGVLMQQVVRSCRLCTHEADCAEWLDAHDDPLGYRRFCPNAEMIECLPRSGVHRSAKVERRSVTSFEEEQRR